MAQTQAVIVYSVSQGVRRRLVLPNDDAQIAMHAANVAPGEAALVVRLSDLRAVGPDALLVRLLGHKTTTDRCAVINAAGVVVAVIHADPSIDHDPRGRLHRDPYFAAVIGQLATGLRLLP